MRIAALVGGAVLVVLAWVAPAEAKGLGDGEISGEGLDAPISLVDGGAWRYEGDVFADFGLSSTMGWGTSDGDPPPALLDDAPTPALGPELRVTWSWVGPEPGPQEVVQRLYPYARGGPLIYTEPGQPLMGDQTLGGWFRGRPALVTRLQALGVPERSVLTGAVAPTGATQRHTASDEGWRWPPVAGGMVIILIAGTAVAVVVRRRRLVPVT